MNLPKSLALVLLPLCVCLQTESSVVDYDANDSNTIAVGGSPSPFWTTAETTGNLWRKRTGFGLDANGNAEIFEKDTPDGVGDATPLQTTVSGLTPGQEYAVYVTFVSDPQKTWRVRAGLDLQALIEFTPVSDADRVTDLGKTSVAGSNRHQYRGYIANQVADGSGQIVVYVDDGEGNGHDTRTWYEGVAVGEPYTLPEPAPLPAGAVEVAPDGVWTWFNDERAIFHQGYLYVGYVRADGHVGLTRYDPELDFSAHTQLSTSRSQQVDDHNNCSITVLPDNRLLVVYSKHNGSWEFYSRTSKVTTPSSLSDWNDEVIKAVPGSNTYANTYRLTEESNDIYNFHRSINFNPCITKSTDNGVSWGDTVQFIKTGSGSVRPYPRYCSDHAGRIDLIYTDGHPRNEDNSIYHMYYDGGDFSKTDGSVIRAYEDLPILHDSGERGSVVYPFSSAAWGAGEGPDDWIPSGRAWTWDIYYGEDGHPVCVFQVQKDNVTGSGWTHDRIYYYYARWTGTEWQRRFIAQAGHGIYNAEDDYGGGMTLDPDDPRVVYISSNAANPFDLSSTTDVPLNTDSRYELYRGFTADGGLTFEWTAVTTNSEKDNLRPIIPENHGRVSQLVWFYGNYTTYQDYNCQVVALFGDEREGLSDWRSEHGISDVSDTADADADGLYDLVEYSLGSDPRSDSDAPFPQLLEGAYAFQHVSVRTDVESVIEVSATLEGNSWERVAIVRGGGLPSSVDPRFVLKVDSDTYSISVDPNRHGTPLFIRLLVQAIDV